jgi:hypothetical protein
MNGRWLFRFWKGGPSVREILAVGQFETCSQYALNIEATFNASLHDDADYF